MEKNYLNDRKPSYPGNGRVPDLCVEVAIPADVEPEVFVFVVLVVRRRQDVQERGRAFAAGVKLVEVVLVRLKLKMETKSSLLKHVHSALDKMTTSVKAGLKKLQIRIPDLLFGMGL